MEKPTTKAIKEEFKAHKTWQRLDDLEEEFLKQKSILHWLEVGDGNNRVFYNAAKIREVRNTIHEIQCADEEIVKMDDGTKKEAERFFADFMSAQPQDYEGVTVERLKDLMGFQCSEIDCEELIREVTKEEIKGVLFKMPGKAPGPDVYTTEFFKEASAIISDYITVTVQSFFIMVFLPKVLNSTILALIPKKTEAN